ncbi:MAG: integrase domain-containing protein, partial [Gammaproteobacteria bacterium]|nr:integrase domain-containing protein [Gammaproteobacteria bacterium]
ALRLQAAFGLRREEAIKFSPSHADRGGRIAVKASTAKGGRAREVPILKDSQRKLLEEARRLAGGGALVPPHRNYAEQRKVYEDQTRAAGLDHMHGLRHAYALDRYEELTGWKAPAAGGPSRRALTGERRRVDTVARLTIASELGHSRLEIARAYVGI